MGRLHSHNYGKSHSTRPLDLKAPSWITQDAKEIEELEREAHRDRHFHGRIGAGYWYVHVGKNVSSVSRIDEKFIEWYEKWVTPIQNKFVFEYERPETKEEEKRREQTYLEMHDERYRD